MSCVLYAVSQDNHDNFAYEICPKCGAKLYTNCRYIICKNYKDAEQYSIVGDKSCDYMVIINKEVK